MPALRVVISESTQLTLIATLMYIIYIALSSRRCLGRVTRLYMYNADKQIYHFALLLRERRKILGFQVYGYLHSIEVVA